jgi:long-chain acyl-CoA synthetase
MLIKTYTLTESAAAACFNNFVNKEYHDTVGLPLPSMEVKICDLEGKEQGVNQRGEIWLRGPNIMKGYWRSPELTEQVLTPEGWFKTGDIAVMNENGYLMIIERIPDLITNEGHTGSAADIENLINTVKGVAESAVVSVKLKSGKTHIKAFVVKKSLELISETILQTCREHLSDFEVPHEIEFTETLPRTTMGYIMKRELRERVLAAVV